jgi:hypothetical protein
MKFLLHAINMVPAGRRTQTLQIQQDQGKWGRFGLIGGNSGVPRGEVPIAKLQRTEDDTGNQP